MFHNSPEMSPKQRTKVYITEFKKKMNIGLDLNALANLNLYLRQQAQLFYLAPSLYLTAAASEF